MFKNKENLLASLYLLIGVGFGYSSTKLKIGDTSNIGPGYFPLIISFFLILIALSLFIKAFLNRKKKNKKMIYDIKTIAMIYLATIIFALNISKICVL